jgi:hypothetical protein
MSQPTITRLDGTAVTLYYIQQVGDNSDSVIILTTAEALGVISELAQKMKEEVGK